MAALEQQLTEADGLADRKSMFIEAESDPTVPPSNDGAYWCSETQVCIGPDGRVVGPAECHPRRSCYDPDTVVKFT